MGYERPPWTRQHTIDFLKACGGALLMVCVFAFGLLMLAGFISFVKMVWETS